MILIGTKPAPCRVSDGWDQQHALTVPGGQTREALPWPLHSVTEQRASAGHGQHLYHPAAQSMTWLLL